MQHGHVLKMLNFDLLTPRVREGGSASKIFATMLLHFLIIPAFFFRKKGCINFVPKLVRRPCVSSSVTFHVKVSPPKPLEVATSNVVAE